MKPKILLALPTPPPFSGQEKIASIILKSKIIDVFECFHVDTSNHQKSNKDRGHLNWKNIYSTLLIGWNLFKVLHRNKNIVLVNLPMACNSFGFLKYSIHLIICRLFDVKIVSRLGASHFKHFYDAQNVFYQMFIKLILKQVACIIVRGYNQKLQFNNIYSGKIKVVYVPTNGIKQQAFNKNFVFKKKSLINILFLGKVSQAKGAYDLIRAIPQMITKDNRLRFHFVGDRVEKEKNVVHLKRDRLDINFFIKENGLEKYVTFHGNLEGIMKEAIMKSSDIFIFPSYSEGSPFAVVEAMEYGLPIVATKVGNLVEICSDRNNVIFVDKQSPTEITNAIFEIISNDSLASEMVKNNIELLKTKLSLNIFEQEMIKIFQDIIHSNENIRTNI